ncbi:MAG: tetratricopeptide repeat protein [Chitinophagaceae bacterium]
MLNKISKGCCSIGVFVVLLGTSLGASASSLDSAGTLFSKGKEFQAARQYANAWSFYEKAAQKNPRSELYQLAIAEVCQTMHRMGPLVSALEAASNIAPTNYETQAKLMKLYFDFGQYSKVIEKLPALQSKLPQTTDWAWILGRSHYSTQNYGQAVQYLKMALKENPKNAEAAYYLGRIMMKEENYKAAIPFYEHSLAVDTAPQAARVYELALICATALQADLSIKYFQKALDLGYKPGDDFYLNMAYTLADDHKADDALKIMRSMLDRRPGDIGLLNCLADVCYHSGRYKESIHYLDELMKMDMNNARALYQIGTAYIKMGRDTEGKQLCDEAISMDPTLAVLKRAKQLM